MAFLVLPVGLIALGRRWLRTPTGRRFAAWSIGLGVLAVVWFSPFVLGLVARPLTGVPWYRVVPIGLVERGLTLTETLAVAVLATWCTRDRCVRRGSAPGRGTGRHSR